MEIREPQLSTSETSKKNEIEGSKLESSTKILEARNHEEIEREMSEKENEVDRRIKETLAWIREAAPEEEGIIKSLQAIESEKTEIGTFKMLRELWKVTPSDCRSALIGEFIFNPAALKERYYEEMYFQSALKSRWKNH